MREEYYENGRHLITFSGSIFYDHPNWLATEQYRSTMTGGLFGVCVNNPFGDDMYCNETEYSPVHFTGKERDWSNSLSPTNLDNFGARYYSSATARFMTPDWAAKPAAVPYANYGNPQSPNLYAYVENNPTTTADLDGHCGAPGTPNDNCGAANTLTTGIKNPTTGTCADPGTSTCPTLTDQKDADQNAQQEKGDTLLLTGSYTTNKPTIALGAIIGEALDPDGGGVVGGLIGSEFGVGATGSYVPSSGSSYVGVTANYTPTPNGGEGGNLNAAIVPENQNPDSIAHGLTFSTSLQPTPFTGVAVTKSPGSGPAVAGPSVGTRVPVSYSVSYEFNVTRVIQSVSSFFYKHFQHTLD